MNKLIYQIKKKLSKKFESKSIEIIDQSYLHKNHKTNQKNKLHIKLIIECTVLKKMNPIEANRKIFSVLQDEIKNNIHSLQIKIK